MEHTVTINGEAFKVYEDDHGTLRFRPNNAVRALLDGNNNYTLNELWVDFLRGNTPIQLEDMMSLYRDIGYSLFGFWEVFGWEVNTEGKFPAVEILLDGEPYPE